MLTGLCMYVRVCMYVYVCRPFSRGMGREVDETLKKRSTLFSRTSFMCFHVIGSNALVACVNRTVL